MILYHVFTGKSSVEYEVIKELQPKNLLLSHYYWRNKSIQQLKEKLGYDFNYLYDSGAFTAHFKGLMLNLDDYIEKIKKGGIKYYLNLDVFGDNLQSFNNFLLMRSAGLKPIPVIHVNDDMNYLGKYLDFGCDYVAIGGTVPMKNKYSVADYVRMFTWQYPEVRFHLLGSSSSIIINSCNIYSCDSSTWITNAVFGKPTFIPGHTREDKKRRALYNMGLELELQKTII